MRRIELTILLAIVLLGTGVRLYGLTDESYWLDEAISVRQAHTGLAESIQLLQHDVHQPAYILLLNVWIHVFGITEVSTRMLSVLFGAVSIVLLYALGKKMFTPKIGLGAALLLALSSQAVFYSQEARLYSMFMCLTIASMYAYTIFLEKQSPKIAAFYVAINVALIYTTIFALFVFLVQMVHIIISRKNLHETLYLGGLLGVVGLLFIPWIPTILNQIHGQSNISWIPFPTGLSVFNTVILPFSHDTLAIVFVFVLLGTLPLYKRLRGSKNRILLSLLWVCLPLMLVFIISYVLDPIYQDRLLLFTFPGWYLLFAVLITTFSEKKRELLYIIFGIIIVYSLVSLSVLASPPLQKDDWKNISVYLKDHVQDGEVVMVQPFFQQDPLTYYYDNECFTKNEDISNCNAAKNNMLSINWKSLCCTNTTFLTTRTPTTLKDYTQSPIWLLEVRNNIPNKNESLYMYFSSRMDKTETKEFIYNIWVSKFVPFV